MPPRADIPSESTARSAAWVPAKPAATAPLGSARSGERPAGTPSRVLVVDDERLIADTVARILNTNGFAAEAVYSGEDAIAATGEFCPDIVLTDMRMPGRNGLETALIIQKQCPQTRVVLFSGQANTEELVARTQGEGHAFELWPKPIHPRELIRRLSEICPR